MERVCRAAAAAALMMALLSGVARAEQVLGVEVYRKAELLSSETAFVKKTVGVDAGCFRTTATFDVVSAFYSRMQGFVSPEPNVLRRGKVDVVVRRPTKNLRTGIISRYTVFCIMQATE